MVSMNKHQNYAASATNPYITAWIKQNARKQMLNQEKQLASFQAYLYMSQNSGERFMGTRFIVINFDEQEQLWWKTNQIRRWLV